MRTALALGTPSHLKILGGAMTLDPQLVRRAKAEMAAARKWAASSTAAPRERQRSRPKSKPPRAEVMAVLSQSVAVLRDSGRTLERLALVMESGRALERSGQVLEQSGLLSSLEGGLINLTGYDIRVCAGPASWTARARELIDFACNYLGHGGPRPRPTFFEALSPGQPWGLGAYGAGEVALSIDVPPEEQPRVVAHEVYHTLDPLRNQREERAEHAAVLIADEWRRLHGR